MPTDHAQGLRVSEEVFRMFCMRVIRDEHPHAPNGVRYEDACQGRPGAVTPDMTPKLKALLDRRGELVEALDQVFAEGTGIAVQNVSTFQDNELSKFLADMIPFYDDETMPRSTRAMARVADKLLDPTDARAQQVLETFARLSPRTGYRAAGDVLAAARPMLSYPRLDQVSQQLLEFVGKEGKGHQVFMQVLQAAALELAEPVEQVADADLPESNLRLAANLLLQQDPSFAEASDPAKYYVRRDAKGVAKLSAGAPPVMGALPSPNAVFGVNDGAARGPDGRALQAPGAPQTLHEYGDANRTLLAALMRDQKPLLERKNPGEPAPVEKLLRGVRALFGSQVPRKETFYVRTKDASNPMDMKGDLAFTGLDVEHSPLIDLVHALTQALRYPETDRLLALLRKLMEENENAAAAPVYMGLAVDRHADGMPNAVLTGYDGKPGTPQEFWDDLIALGMRMAERPGMLKDVTQALTSDEGVASARLMGRFMGFKDEVTYEGYPLKLGADGKLSQADADKMNKPVEHEMADPVTMRGPGMDIGMNRSLFQRLVSTIYATNGAPNCNKEGATLTAKDPTTGTSLVFPDPTKKPAQCNGDLVCDTAAALAYTTIDGLCGVKPGAPTGTFKRCEFVQQSNGAEMHMRAMIGASDVKLKNEQLKCLSDANLAGDLGATQESSSQIKGFTLKPTAESIARFVHAPRNKFVTDLFDPLPTLFGEPVITYEPNMLLALEAKHSAVQVGGQPQSFLTASKALAAAFDKHETFEDTPNGKESKGGYMFADLLGMLHQHWPSRSAVDCPRTDDHPTCKTLGLTGTACSAGCSQSLDPKKPYYSRQSNLVSYEPLLIKAFEEERLSDLLALSTKVIAGMQIECEDGKTRDGLTVVGDFFERMLKPDPALAVYSTKRKYGKTNTCVGEQVDASTGTGSCGCPGGSSPVDAADASSGCKLPSGVIVPRGRIVGLTPLHLALDALRRFDDVFADPMWAERLAPWREARSALVDQFLTVTKTPDPTDPMDATKAKYKLANPRSRKVGIMLVDFVRGRIKRYRDLDPQGGSKLSDWASGLPTRLAGVLAHPLTARGLDLYEELWKPEYLGAGGPADEMARLNTYLLDATKADVFGGLVLASADTLEMADKDRSLTPAIQFAALTLAENAFNALDSLMVLAPTSPLTEEGTAACSLEVTRKVAKLHKDPATLSPLTRLLRNAVLPNPLKQGRSPIETIVDAVSDVNRADPSQLTTVPHSAADARNVFDNLRFFLFDQDRGLERLYNVIDSRKLPQKVP